MEVLDIGYVKPPFPQSDVTKLKTALGPNVLIVREGLPEKTSSGLYLPGNAKIVKRRGWVIFAGTGTYTKKGVWIRPPWKKGDYLVADRAYDRADPTEDDLCTDPAVMFIKSEEVLAMDSDRRPPPEVQKILDAYGD